MLRPEHDEGRPGEGRPRTSLARDIHIVAAAADTCRCTRCNRLLKAPESVRLEVGPVCRHRAVA